MKLRKILIIMIWLIGIAGILLLRIVGWMNRQVPIGRQALSMAGSELRIKIDPHNPSNHPRGFIAVIEYISGRQGPYATLTIYKQRELAPDSTYTQISNMEEIPVRIWPSSELKIRDQDLRPRREAWGPGIHQIRVAEDELFPTDAFISPMLDDHYIPQFFIYQGDDVNRRTDPIIAGSYMLRYDKSQQKWVLSKFGGFQAFLFIGSGIWKAQVTVLSAMLLLTVLLCQVAIIGKEPLPKRSYLQQSCHSFVFSCQSYSRCLFCFCPYIPWQGLLKRCRRRKEIMKHLLPLNNRPFKEMQ